MIYRDFQGEQLSMLGFGTMRLPVQPDGSIDRKLRRKIEEKKQAQGLKQ